MSFDKPDEFESVVEAAVNLWKAFKRAVVRMATAVGRFFRGIATLLATGGTVHYDWFDESPGAFTDEWCGFEPPQPPATSGFAAHAPSAATAALAHSLSVERRACPACGCESLSRYSSGMLVCDECAKVLEV
jgi:hypothetical protein